MDGMYAEIGACYGGVLACKMYLTGWEEIACDGVDGY